MARIKITLYGAQGGVLVEASESLALTSARCLFNTLDGMMKPLAENFREVDATGKIPMNPIRYVGPVGYCLECGHAEKIHNDQIGCTEEYSPRSGTTICSCKLNFSPLINPPPIELSPAEVAALGDIKPGGTD